MKAVLYYVCLLAFAEALPTNNKMAGEDARLDDAQRMVDAAELFEEFWTWRLQRSPEFSSLAGSADFNDQLEIFTESRFEEDRNTCQLFNDRAGVLLNSTTDEGLALNLDLFMAETQTFIDGYPFKGFYYPMNYMEGVQVDFQKLTEWAIPTTVKDYEDAVARYVKFNELAGQIVAMMRAAMKAGWTNHAASMAGVEQQCRDHLGEPRETVFYEPFKTMENISDTDIKRLQAAAADAIVSSVQPGFSTLAEFLAGEYSAALRPEIAASSIPGIGPEFYKACLAFHTSTSMTPQEIHDKGLEEVERIETEMKEIVIEMGYNLTLPEFIQVLRNDKANYFNSPEELMAAFHEIIENRINPRILDLFHTEPQTKLEIVEVPPSTPDAPAAYYIAGTADGKRPGRLFVNTNKYDSQPRYEMISLSLHETNPGHHLQGSYMVESTGLPSFRKVMEDRIYAQTPSRFPINTAYTEGWGLYSESLGFDLNLYDDPLDRYGHLSEEIFRACRLVVDTGMHALGWSREDAVNYMLAHTAASPENIRGEVDRYVTWPGQATGYKIGQLKIRELRTKAQTSLADKFNIKDFHEVVLKSAGPLYILEAQVNKYIQENSA